MSKSPLEALRSQFVANLLHVCHNATPHARVTGASWYPNARAIVHEWATHYAIHDATVANVIAALSPQCEWTRNLIIADDLLADRPISIGGALHANITKARKALAWYNYGLTGTHADMLRLFPQGPKVNCFAANLAGDDTLVTVDTHAIQAAFDDVTVTRTLKWSAYRVVAECYAEAAARVGLAPATFQAIVWHAWKERYPADVKRHARRQF